MLECFASFYRQKTINCDIDIRSSVSKARPPPEIARAVDLAFKPQESPFPNFQSSICGGGAVLSSNRSVQSKTISIDGRNWNASLCVMSVRSIGSLHLQREEEFARPQVRQLLERGAQIDTVGLNLCLPDEYLHQDPNSAKTSLVIVSKELIPSREKGLESRSIKSKEILEPWERLFRERKLSDVVGRICSLIAITGFANTSIRKNFALAYHDANILLTIENLQTYGLFTKRESNQDRTAEQRIQACAKVGLEQFRHSFHVAVEAAAADEQLAVGSDWMDRETQEKVVRSYDGFLRIVDWEVQKAITNVEIPAPAHLSALKRVHQLSKHFNWPLIIGSILLPLIPIALLIVSVVRSYPCMFGKQASLPEQS